jgi:gas vesicle protein
MKQQLNEEFRRMQKLAGTKLGENISEANEDLFSKYKEKLEEFREEFVKDIKANKDKLKKLSNEDKKKLSKLIRDITDALDNTLPNTQ